MSLTTEWIGFMVLIVAMLALDLFVFNRKAHVIKFKEAMAYSVFWIGVALIFNFVVYKMHGPTKGMEFLTGYIIEKSLSVDNLFVFLMLFSYFRVNPIYQHKILFWGIIGALVMRFVFIWLGVELIERFHWIIYVFGGFLIYTGIKMAIPHDEELHPDQNPVIKLARKLIPITNHHDGGHFFVKEAGKWMATPLFIVLLTVETTDLIFAVDSIPAVLAISRDPFIVFTSNVMAILGLRALYFALSGVMDMFHYLKYGLSIILVFVGAKMIISGFYKIPIAWALGVVAGILALSVLVSWIFPKKKETPPVKLSEE